MEIPASSPEESSRKASRVKHSVGKRSVAASDIRIKSLSPAPSEPQVLKGLERVKIPKHLEYLQALKERVGSAASRWQELLSGDNVEVSGRRLVSPNIPRAIRQAGAEQARVMSIHKYVETGVDYKDLTAQRPTKRYKFYHSFSDAERATGYVTAVVAAAKEADISLSMKSFDHEYDGVNFYTYHFRELDEIIKNTYPEYQDAFGSTEHFLQGPVEGVDSTHIGWAQEPVRGGDHSHSGRMGLIGEALDRGGISEASYREGCAAAGVRPDYPWLLTAEYEQQVFERATSTG